MPARHMALSLGAEGIEYLDRGQFQSFLSYRWLRANEGYIGADKWSDYDDVAGADIKVHSFDWNLTYGLSRRFSLSVTQPFVYGRVKSRQEHDPTGDGKRHTTHGSGIGDIRLTANAWLWDPDVSQKGNVSVSFGLKAPTGQYDMKDTFHRPAGPERHEVDIAIQPADGGWGLILETQAFRNVFDRTYLYASGFYLANPENTNGARTQAPLYGPDPQRISIPDQYQARAGVSYAIWPHQGLAVSLGARIDGMNRKDLIGESDGFRRPGYAIYAEPGLTLSRGKNTFSLSVPVLLGANREKNVLDEEADCSGSTSATCGHGAGAYSDYLILFSVSRRF